MKATLLITYHEKALKILEMIEKAQCANDRHREQIKRLEGLEFWHPYKQNIPKLVDRIKVNADIIERLTNYYTALMQKMNYQVVLKSIAA
jgi:hypothetical protein